MTTIADSVRAHLPFLRRYARSLTGSQAVGDACVGEVLEAIAADPACIGKHEDPRVGLYRVFARMWNGGSADSRGGKVAAGPEDTLIDRRIKALMPVPRQAFLLVAMEGFTAEEAARILGRSPRQIEDDLDEAGREIAAQVATDVLIIEDEPMIAHDLSAIVTGIGHSVCGFARTRSEATAAVATRRPGLILADVLLADGSSGIDTVRDILGSINVPVIFITAYPEEVLTGLRPEPTFLIPKPFNIDTVRTIISQALFFDVKARNVAA